MHLWRPTGIAWNVGHPSDKMHASTGDYCIEYADVLFRAFGPSTLDASLTGQARSCCRAEVFAIFQATVQTTTA
jgi:hypothetical protein